MRDRLSMVIAIVLLTIVTATSYWYSREMRLPTKRTAPTPGTPDFVVDHVVMTQFDDSGQARYKLFSERLTHFTENDDIELVKPRLVSLRPNRPQVQAVSNRARISNAGEQVLMEGDVVITRAASGEQPPLTIRSASMLAFPDEDRFRSDAPVEIERGDTRLSGAAMQYENTSRVLTVNGDVKGEIAPARP